MPDVELCTGKRTYLCFSKGIGINTKYRYIQKSLGKNYFEYLMLSGKNISDEWPKREKL